MKRQPTGKSGRQGEKPGPANLKLVRSEATKDSTPGERSVLSRLDWIATALIAVTLLIAPIWATSFPTPGRPTTITHDALAVQGYLSIAMEVWAPSFILAMTSAAFCIMAWREWKRPVAIVAVSGLSVTLGLTGIWAIFSASANPALYTSLNAISVLLAGLLLGGMLSRLCRDGRALAAILLTIALAGSVIAGIGVREYLGELRLGVVDHRTFSTFGPDFLAGYLLLTLPVTLAAFASSSQRSLRIALGVGLALQSGCIFLTGSRAGTAIALVAALGWAVLAFLVGADRGRRREIAAGIGIFLLASIVSAAPTLGRYGSRKPTQSAAPTALVEAAAAKPAEDSQGHSGAFRKSTWIGTVRMATRNPVFGTGIGSFGSAYPKYADTMFTAHAHNSLLQWTAETGLPGAFLLLAAFGSASAFVLHTLLQVRSRRNDLRIVEGKDAWVGSPGPAGGAARAPDGVPTGTNEVDLLLPAHSLLYCGLVASLGASALHNMFDSDLYVVATLLTFCALFGITIAQARALAPSAAQPPKAVGRELWAVGLAVCLFLIVRGGQMGFARWDRAQVDNAIESHQGAEAIGFARAAAAADPFDVEPRLALAQLLRGHPESEAEFKAAVRIAPGGMTYYLLGRHFREQADLESDRLRKAEIVKMALEALERSHAFDPHNLQVLKAIADLEFSAGVEQNDSGLIEQAGFYYQTMANLEHEPYGTIRAVPELIETDYAFAHKGLAEIATREQNFAVAEKEYREALRILRRYWEARNWLVNLNRTPEKRKATAEMYVQTLHRTIDTLAKEGKNGDLPSLDAEIARVEADRVADEPKPDPAVLPPAAP